MYEYCTVPELLVLVPYYSEIVLSTARVRIQVLVLVRTPCRDAAYEYGTSTHAVVVVVVVTTS